MSPRPTPTGPAPSSFPRVSGDEPADNVVSQGNELFSPRERG